MLCEKCKKNNATVFYREIINGKEKKYSLCSECAAEMENSGEISLNNETIFDSFFEDYNPITDLFSSLFTPAYLTSPSQKKVKRCNLCGSTFDDLVSSGKVGCTKCYEVFSEELAPSINRIHGSTKHIGKLSKKIKEESEKKKKISSLEQDMKAAIKSQEFERAAEIRDQLRELRNSEGGC